MASPRIIRRSSTPASRHRSSRSPTRSARRDPAPAASRWTPTSSGSRTSRRSPTASRASSARSPSRPAAEQLVPALRDERGIDFVTANGENVAGGMGLTASTAQSLLAAGIDVITSGNHIWDKREIYAYLETTDRVLRPLNYGTQG